MQKSEVTYYRFIHGPLDGEHMSSIEKPLHDTTFRAGTWVYAFDVRRLAWVFIGYSKQGLKPLPTT